MVDTFGLTDAERMACPGSLVRSWRAVWNLFFWLSGVDLLRKSGEFFVMKEDLDDQAEAANEGI